MIMATYITTGVFQELTFNEQRDYLYPIPIHERSLNNSLTQNPGWDDGLGF